MAYTVLARRYRSNSFDEVVGQGHIAQTLKKAIESGRIAHAYLFCGTRGTGKTSVARILAKCLNCQSADHPVTVPCGKCDSCQAIARGDDIDVIEIDAASNTGVDNVRDAIIATSYNMPARARFKVFIIDEVHMLSKQAFNALLKTLEEPPSHVKFILATTEPEKVLPTILSRCQRYDFRNIPTREIAGHLRNICLKEKIEAEEDALLLVAKAGAGSMRDALSLLDRLLSVGEKTLTADMIEQLLGLPKAQLIFDLVAAIAAGDVKAALSQTDAIISGGLSLDSLLASLIDHLRNLMVLRTCGAVTDLVEVPGLIMTELIGQADMFDTAALSQDIVILEELRRHARQSQAGRALLDATLVRLVLADQFASLGDVLARVSGRTAPSPAEKKKSIELNRPATLPPRVIAVPPRVIAPALSQGSSDEPSASADLDAIDVGDDAIAVGKVFDGPARSLGQIMADSRKPHAATATTSAPATEHSEPNIEPVAGDAGSGWAAMMKRFEQDNPSMFGLLSQAKLMGIDADGQAVVRFSKQNESLVRLFDRNGKKEAVREALSQAMQQPVGVRFEVSEVETPVIANAPPAASNPRPSLPARQSSAPKPTAAAPIQPPVPAANTIRITEEIRARLYKEESLVRAIVDQLGGTIIKIEE